MFNFQRPVDCALNDWQIVFRAKFQLVADPLPLFAVPAYDFRVEILLHGKPADFDKLDHNREAGDCAFIFNIGKIAPFNSHYFGQHLARQVLCFPRSFHVRAESFKAGAIFNFRHITSPIYIV